jgi:hypothetical protein
LRPHACAYGLGSVIFLVVDLLASEGRWFYWPVLVWGFVVLLHYIYVKSVSIDTDWAARRTTEVADRAYDLSHIEDIRKRYEGAAPPGDADAKPEDRRAAGRSGLET